MRPPASLLDQLMTSRFLPARARPTVGTGERRSAIKGAGMEFVDHRPYREGDDTRHLDPHVLARTGETVIREYAQSRQLPVTILLDLSGSMTAGGRAKHRMAVLVAQVLGYVALAAGDRAQVVTLTGDGLHWSPRWQGGARADMMFAWIAAQQPGGSGTFAEALRQVIQHLPHRGMLILVSDWWDKGVRQRLETLKTAGHEVLAMQILAAEERDPALIGQGVVTVADAESGEEVQVMLDADTLRRYQAMRAELQERLAALFARLHWQFFELDAEADISEFCLRTLRGKGVIS